MSYKIEEIEGIGPTYGEKLRAADIQTTDDLLTACADPKGRRGHGGENWFVGEANSEMGEYGGSDADLRRR